MAVNLVKETGSGVSGANTYVNQTDFETYCDGRGLSYSAYTDDQKEEAILRGMDFVEALPWKGTKADEANALRWPRSSVEDADGNAVDSDEVPTGVFNAACRAAYEEVVTSGTLLANLTRDDLVKSEKVGPISTEYFEYAAKQTLFQAILAHCEEYLTTGANRSLMRT